MDNLEEWTQQRKAQELPEYVTNKPWCSFHEEFIEVDSHVDRRRVNLISWLPCEEGGNNRNSAKEEEEEEDKEDQGNSCIVYISHGLHEHVLKYHMVAEELTKRGMKVYGADHMAHGLTYGVRGLIKDHKQLIADQIEVISTVRKRHPSETKFFLLGHSMGTLVAMNSITEIDPPVSGVCLSGTATIPGPAAASPFGLSCLYPLGQSCIGICLASWLSFLDEQGPAAPIYMEALMNSWVEREIWRKDPRRFAGH